MPFEVITFGEAMLRLSPPNFRRLEQARSLDVLVGGAELNTAAALARLGRSTAWVSRLTNNPLGRLVANQAREAGVGQELAREGCGETEADHPVHEGAHWHAALTQQLGDVATGLAL